MTFILGLPRSRLLSSALACLFACGVALTSNATASEPKAQPGQFSAQLVTGPTNGSSVRYTDWRTAPRHSAELLPDPVLHRGQAMVFVLAARAFRWRGHFAVHPWVVFKREGEESYTRYEVMGWGDRLFQAFLFWMQLLLPIMAHLR